MIAARLGARLWWGLPLLLLLLVGTGAVGTGSIPGIPVTPLITQLAAPIAGFAEDVALALTLGCLVTLLWSGTPRVRRWAVAWTATSMVLVALTAITLQSEVTAGRSLWDPVGMLELLRGTAIGWAVLVQAVCLTLALVSICLNGVLPWRWLLWAAVLLTAVSVAAPAVAGHAGLSGEHQVAGVSTGLHAVAISLWVGGLSVVSTRCLQEPDSAKVLLPRFSLLALICVIVSAQTGLLSASLTVGTVPSLAGSTYGSLVLVKAALMAWLIWLGWQQRRLAVDRLPDASVPATVARIAGIELLLMASAISAAVVMVRIGPPAIPGEGIAPLSVIALGIGVPMLAAWLRPVRARIPNTWPEATMVLLLIVIVQTGGVGLLRMVLGVPGLVLELASLLLFGWLACSAVLRSRGSWVIGLVGVPVAMWLNGLLAGGTFWPLVVLATLIGEVLLLFGWTMGRRRGVIRPRTDQVMAT